MAGSRRLMAVLAGVLVPGCASAPPPAPPPPTVSTTQLWPSPRAHPGYDPRDRIVLSKIAEHGWDGEDRGSVHLADILRHTQPGSRWFHDDAQLPTVAHETHHGLQTANARRGREPARFFYFERGFGALVLRPRSSLRLLRRDGDVPVYTEDAHTTTVDVRERVPGAARTIASLRYEIYLTARARERYGVLTLLNEWNAYLAAGRVAVELWHGRQYYEESRPGFQQTNRIRRLGELDGMVDFLYFTSAGIAALMDKEPEYVKGNEQLRAVYAVLAEETMRWHRRGLRIPIFSGFHGPELLQHFVESPENVKIRRALREWLGPQWTLRTFGF